MCWISSCFFLKLNLNHGTMWQSSLNNFKVLPWQSRCHQASSWSSSPFQRPAFYLVMAHSQPSRIFFPHQVHFSICHVQSEACGIAELSQTWVPATQSISNPCLFSITGTPATWSEQNLIEGSGIMLLKWYKHYFLHWDFSWRSHINAMYLEAAGTLRLNLFKPTHWTYLGNQK